MNQSLKKTDAEILKDRSDELIRENNVRQELIQIFNGLKIKLDGVEYQILGRSMSGPGMRLFYLAQFEKGDWIDKGRVHESSRIENELVLEQEYFYAITIKNGAGVAKRIPEDLFHKIAIIKREFFRPGIR